MLYLIDLFCGAGGFSTGAKMAGAKVILAIDIWETALKTHESNHPEAIHLNYKLGENKEEIVELIQEYIPKLKNGDQVHIHGSPPCQNLTTINSAISRNEVAGLKLTIWTLELFLELEKKKIVDSWTIEQVNNLSLKNKLGTYKKINYKLFDMCEYNVPQIRKRMIVSNKSLEKIKQKTPKLLTDIIKCDDMVYIQSSSCIVFRDPKIVPFSYTVVTNPHFCCDKNKNKIRPWTIEEMALIQTFPKKYKFYYRILQDYKKQIANSVPPNFSKLLIISMII
jgi:site-specific DNA-cytosine methylase